MDADDIQPTPYYKLTFGSFNRKDSRLRQTKAGVYTVGQSQCIVMVAWMYHFKYKPYHWNGSHLDNIICKGDWLHYLWELATHDGETTDSLLKLKTGCTFSKQSVQYESVEKLSFFGKFTGLRGKLKKYMATCDENERSILFTCKQISFGIFGYIGPNGDIEYCLFDPHGRNSEGYFDYSEKSSILCCKTIGDVVTLLARDEIFAQCRYTCVPIKRKPILSTDRLIWVEIHNSGRFVNEYLSGDGWMESSGSSDDDNEIEDSDSGENRLSKETAVTLSDRPIRAVKAPIRLTFDPHPSFFRGKIREDIKRSQGKWNRWYDSKEPEQKEKYKRRRNRRLLRKQLFQL